MAASKIDWKFAGDVAAEQEAEAARLAKRKHDAEFAPGPDLRSEACTCGKFGPWGDGKAHYCADHVPAHLRYAGQFFAETME